MTDLNTAFKRKDGSMLYHIVEDDFPKKILRRELRRNGNEALSCFKGRLKGV